MNRANRFKPIRQLLLGQFFLQKFVNVSIYYNPVEECLTKVVEEALFPVQKSEPYDISVKKVEYRTRIQRKMIPPFLEPKCPLIWRSQEQRSDRRKFSRPAPLNFLNGSALRKTQLFRNPKADVTLFDVVFSNIEFDFYR